MCDPKCPYCDGELLDVGIEKGLQIYWCESCQSQFYEDSYGDLYPDEGMSDDDFELANFCHGGDLKDD